MNIENRILGLFSLTIIIAGIIIFLVYTSMDHHWGSGFWEQFIATHSHVSIQTIDKLVYWFRKSLHFFGYGLLGLLTWFYCYLWGFRKAYWPGILMASLIAAFDEFLQSRVPFRSGKPEDVLLDICGVVIITVITKHFLNKSFLVG